MDMITLAMAKAYSDNQRLAYVEEKETEFFPKTTFEGFQLVDSFDVAVYSVQTSYGIPVEAGKQYTVVFDGVRYKCVAKAKGTELSVLGDPSYDPDSSGGITGNGEPFCIWTYPGENYAFIDTTIPGSSHTVEIYAAAETVHTIDPKYLPKGGVGYSEVVEQVWFPETACPANEHHHTVQYENPLSKDSSAPKPDELIAVLDGVEYILPNVGSYGYGNPAAFNPSLENNGLPVCYMPSAGSTNQTVFFADKSVPHTLKIVDRTETVHHIEQKYIPTLSAFKMIGANGKTYMVGVDTAGYLYASEVTE